MIDLNPLTTLIKSSPFNFLTAVVLTTAYKLGLVITIMSTLGDSCVPNG
jgi:hypothetical protein